MVGRKGVGVLLLLPLPLLRVPSGMGNELGLLPKILPTRPASLANTPMLSSEAEFKAASRKAWFKG